jgi:hypothetical protein
MLVLLLLLFIIIFTIITTALFPIIINIIYRYYYYYYYAEDLSCGRSKHGDAQTQIEVQRETTPIAGLAFSRAWGAWGDRFYLEAGRAAAFAP